MPSHRPTLPHIPQPTKIIFDPFNSSSTGHQRAESRLSGSTSWRESRSYKLSHQFRDVGGRGCDWHVAELVETGSEPRGSGSGPGQSQDGKKPDGGSSSSAPCRDKGWQDIRGFMNGVRKRKRSIEALPGTGGQDDDRGDVDEVQRRAKKRQSSQTTPYIPADADALAADVAQEVRDILSETDDYDPSLSQKIPPLPPPQRQKHIFRGLTMYLNGSTAPLVSDHKLKQLFVRHGGQAAITLARRTVTHVVIGETRTGGGGGLASGKIEKEVSTVAGKGIKYVTAQWVLDSVEKGIRQPEARYAPTNLSNRIGGNRQRSVRSIFIKQ